MKLRYKPKTVICLGVVLLIGGIVVQVQAMSGGAGYSRIDGMIDASVGVYLSAKDASGYEQNKRSLV